MDGFEVDIMELGYIIELDDTMMEMDCILSNCSIISIC
jgi:hypothetical protein